MRIKKRRGLRRVLAHIALFALLGVFALSTGLVGRGLLNRLADSQREPARAREIHAQTEALAKAAMLAAAPDKKQQSAVNTGFSSKRKGVESAIRAQVEAGLSNEAIVSGAIDAYIEGVSGRLKADEAALGAVTAAIAVAREDVIAQVDAKADAAAAAITTQSVRASMSVSATKNYAVMFYADALTVIGAVSLLLCALLTLLWFTRDEEGRVKIAQFLEPIDYLLPFFAGVAVFTLYPMVRVAVMSFQEKYKLGNNGFGTFAQWGLGNYKFVLLGVEGTSNVFLRGLKNTAIYVALTVPLSTAVSIIMAYLLNQKIRLNGAFQTAYFIPMVTSVTAVGLVWRWMFNTKFGLVNAIGNVFGAGNLNWLGDYPMTVLVIFGVWSSLPFTIILLLSGLQNIDDNLYTVARVDGSGAARIFFRITVPLLSPTIGLVLIINSISAFKVYTDVVVLWNGAPENYGMQTVTWYIYDQMNTSADGMHYLGYAAAAAMVLFLIIFAFTMAQKVIQRKWVYQ